jgi:hypothetical protein
MAKVIVAGEVEEVKQTSTGKIIIKLTEVYPSQTGEQWLRKWALWMPSSFMADEVAKDDWLEVEGDLSTKVTEWVNPSGVTKQIIDHNINQVRIVQHKAQAQPAAPLDDEDDRRKYGSGLAPF